MQLGMIGLGRMGANMVRRLLKGGHECVAFDRNAEAVKELTGEGAKGAASLDELIAQPVKQRLDQGHQPLAYRARHPSIPSSALYKGAPGNKNGPYGPPKKQKAPWGALPSSILRGRRAPLRRDRPTPATHLPACGLGAVCGPRILPERVARWKPAARPRPGLPAAFRPRPV